MKKTTKTALGIVGLATVAALTIVAAGIESPANAVSGEVTLQYAVIDEGKTNEVIELPVNNSKTTSNIIPVKVIYGATSTIEYSLSYTDSVTGQTITINLPDYETPVYDGGIHSWELNLDDYDLGYGTYILHVNVLGNGAASDSVTFTYQAATIDPIPNSGTTTDEDGNLVTDDNGKLDLALDHSSETDHLQIDLLNSDGTPYIDPITGQPVTIYVGPEELASGKLTLDLSGYGLKDGSIYLLKIKAFDSSDNLIDTVIYSFRYHIVSAEVPNTGGSIFAALNLSNTDFLASALIIFGAATIGAFVLIKKSSRR